MNGYLNLPGPEAKRFGGLVLLAVLLLTAAPLRAQQVEVREETLDNGMKFLFLERHDSPTIACGWVARVGSVDERPGITGMSHLFEHLMFKGTEAIGVKDPERDREIRSRQDEIWAEMETEYDDLREKLRRGEIEGTIYDPENVTPRLRELRTQLEELFEQEKQVIVSTEIDKVYTREGGLGLNAGTTKDQTLYFIFSIPANKLELWYWLESDRLLNPVFREFYAERDVVREERRRSTESTPTGKLDEIFDSLFWQSAPYSWPVIGWATDVESITRPQAEEYFATYYAPNNITGVLVGDFDSDEALALAQKYFGRIPRGETDPPEVITSEIDQIGIKRYKAEAETNPQVFIRYHAPAFNHQDNAALKVLADALNGRTGRLYKVLVEEMGLAVGQPFAYLQEYKYGGYFQLGAEVKEGKAPQDVERALLAEIERLKAEPLESRELEKIKNRALANSYRRLSSNQALLFQLLVYDSLGDWNYINYGPDKIQAVTAADVQSVAETYLDPEKLNVGWYLRKAGVRPEDPELSSLPEQVRAMVKQQLAQIEQSEDAAALEGAIVQMEQMKGQAPPEMVPAFEYLIKKIRERLEFIAPPAETEGGN